MLIEHKSGKAPYLLLQLAAYHLAIVNKFRRVRKGNPVVPWVLPVVIVNSQEKLAAPVAFTEMIKAPSTIWAASMEGEGWLMVPVLTYLAETHNIEFEEIR